MKNEDRDKHSIFTVLQKESKNLPGPLDYKIEGSILKKTFNKSLITKKT